MPGLGANYIVKGLIIMEDWKKYYAAQSVVTEPGEYKSLYDNLPNDISSLCKVIQGLLVHLYWAPDYGISLSDERKAEVKIRKTTRQLTRILELADLPLAIGRPVEKRMVGTCRDYAVLLISFLRHKGIPARMRAGFATYLKPGSYENHYLCQYWNDAQSRWIMVDAQLDENHCRSLNIRFDPCDLPEDQFFLTGKAWQMCRQGKTDPEKFGILDFRGMWYIGGGVIHDMLALNNIESQPWDIWQLMPYYQQKEYPPDYLGILDHIAALSGEMLPSFTEVRSFYQTETKLQPPSGWEP
jgi:hypothetical protein